ncbi:MAG: O-antigen ligase family protein [Actinomycetales bacterium]|nr:O-antigen ligase family protein [Actinomycetales bacterium]
MALFVVRIPLPGLLATFPLGDLAAVLLVVIALLRPTKESRPIPAWYVVFFALLMLFLIMSSTANEVDWAKRCIKIVTLAALAALIASGRVDLISGLRGLSLALLINIPLFFLGLTPDFYGGALTGYIGDKNIAGFYYTVVPILLLAFTDRAWQRWAIISLSFGAVTLTGSRSSIAAYGFALLWLLFSRRLNTLGKIVLGAILFFVYQFINDNFAQIGEFTSRVGSDLLRLRIDEASQAKVDMAPWYGLGLGQSQVQLQGSTWFFHNSYLALIVEGGLVVAIAIVGLYAVVGLQLFQPKIQSFHARVIEAATVAVFLCALRLGEVFFTLPGFLVIGMGLLLMAERNAMSKGPGELLTGKAFSKTL